MSFKCHSKIKFLTFLFQESRLLTTVPILEASLRPEKCLIYRERRFYESDYPELFNILSQPNSLLLYPGPQGLFSL